MFANALEILARAGVLHVELPFLDFDTRLVERVANSFTEKFWRSGQIQFKFDVKPIVLRDQLGKNCEAATAASCTLVLEKVETTSRERSFARMHLPSFGLAQQRFKARTTSL